MKDARLDILRWRLSAPSSLARTIAAAAGIAVLVGAGTVACGGGAPANAKSASDVRSETLTHEDCSGSKVAALDTNNDGKPDVQRFYDSGGRELCRIADLNHDGKPDLYEYFDASGNVRRREYCYDDTGTVNAIEYYDAGKLTRREYDVRGRHHIDTWDWFDPGLAVDAKTGRPAHPSRRERDTTGDGRIDQWWTWNGDVLSIANDRDGDGKPDPDTAIVLGGDGGAPLPTAAPGASASAAPASSSAAPVPAPGASGPPGLPPPPPPGAPVGPAGGPALKGDGGPR